MVYMLGVIEESQENTEIMRHHEAHGKSGIGDMGLRRRKITKTCPKIDVYPLLPPKNM